MANFRAVYEFADQDGHYGGTVMLPVVGYDDAPGGHAVVLIATPSAYLPDPGPISTRLLPGMARFRRKGEEPFGALYDDDQLDSDDLTAADSGGVLDRTS